MTDEKRGKTRSGEKSRQRIIAETRTLLAENDLQSLTLDDIARRSGVAKSSILWHFGSKNGLLLAVVDDIFLQMQTWIADIAQNHLSQQDYLQACVLALADGFEAHPEANALLISFITQKTLDATIRARIQAMYQEYRQFIGTLLTKVDARFGESEAALVLAVIDGAFLQWYLEPALDFKALLLRAIQLLPSRE